MQIAHLETKSVFFLLFKSRKHQNASFQSMAAATMNKLLQKEKTLKDAKVAFLLYDISSSIIFKQDFSDDSNFRYTIVFCSDLTVLDMQKQRAIDIVEDSLEMRHVLCYSEFRACALIRHSLIILITMKII